MSFASDIKDEILTNTYDEKALKAELYGILKTKSEIKISNHQLILQLTTVSNTLVRRVITTLKKLYDLNVDIYYKQRTNLDKKKIYQIQISAQDDKMKDVLMDLGMIDGDYNSLDMISNKYRVNTKDVIRGMFLGRGSINDPRKSRYHLEIVTKNASDAKYIIDHLEKYNIHGKISARRDTYLFYLKKAEQIGDFLKLIDAKDLLFTYENERIKKDLNNMVNRVINCDMANGMKSKKSSDKQLQDIKVIEDTRGLESLSTRLMEAVLLRVNNPDASFQELSDVSEDEIGRYISKSGISHCFKDIEIMAIAIQETKNK
ncbi:MAG: DNA-binding protein WhiA [Bacilli bacterium]